MKGLNKIKKLTNFNDFYQEDVVKIIKKYREFIDKVEVEYHDTVIVYLAIPRNSDDYLIYNRAIVEIVQKFNADEAEYLPGDNAIRFWWD